MKISNNERIADGIRWDVSRSSDYRDNPLNKDHYQYQLMVDRCFAVFLVVMYFVAHFVAYGFVDGLIRSIGIAAGVFLSFFVTCLIIILVTEVISDFKDWIRGY